MNNKHIVKQYDSFMTNVNKLSVGKSTYNPIFGRVTLIQPADYSKGTNMFLGRAGYGTRKFSVSKSTVISNGKYTLGGLRKKLKDACID